MTTLTFNDVTFNPVPQNDGQIWLTSAELAKALGYAETDSISKLYNRNKDEFTSGMTMTVKMTVNGINNSTRQKLTRIFSLRGCHLLAMFAKTEIAKQFRVWVLNILDKEVGEPITQSLDPISTVQDRRPLVKAVNMLVDETGAIISNVWRMVHQRFNVKDVEELTKAQVTQAIEYVHSLFMQSVQKPITPQPQPKQKELYDILFCAVSSHVEVIRMTKSMMSALHMGYHENSQLKYVQKYIEDTIKYSLDYNMTNMFGEKLYDNGRLHTWHGGSFAIK